MLPREQRTLSATYATGLLHGTKPVVELQGWNAKPKKVSAR
ncbi:MAG: hypothetical protein ACP5XB_12655 [Isosphaeraceae bacterium]